jgi:predicted transcriptional regulator
MTIPFKSLGDKWMQDPAFVKEYERIGPAMQLAFELASERQKAGLTQAQIAERMGTSQAAIARLEAGKMKPKWQTIERYAEALGMRPSVSLVRIMS